MRRRLRALVTGCAAAARRLGPAIAAGAICAVNPAGGRAAAPSAPGVAEVAAQCAAPGLGPADALRDLAERAARLFAAGSLEIAAACAEPLRSAAADASLGTDLRLAALRAYARLSSSDPTLAAADFTARTLEALAPSGSAGPPDAWRVRIEHGVLLALLRQSAAAATALEAALAAPPPPTLAEPELDRLRGRRYLAVALADSERAAQAPSLAGQVLDDSERLLGPDHVETLLAALTLGTLRWRAYELATAQAAYDQAASGFARTLGPSHPYALSARQGLGVLALRRGRFQEALQTLGAAVADARRERPADDREVLALETALGYVQAEAGELRAAEATFSRMRQINAARYGELDDRTVEMSTMLSFVRYWLGDGTGAMRAAEQALLGRARYAEPQDPRRLADEGVYAAALQLVGRADEATARLERALATGLPVHGAGHEAVLQLQIELAVAYIDRGRDLDAIPILRRVDAAFADKPQDMPQPRLIGEQLLALALLGSGRADEALPLVDAALARRRKAFGEASPLSWSVVVTRARVLLALGRVDEARSELSAAVSALTALPAGLWRDLFDARAALAQAHALLGDTEAASIERRLLVVDVERIRASLDDSPAVRQAYLREWVPQYKRLALDDARAGNAAEAFRVAERARARTLLEGLRSRRADESGPTDARDRDALAALAGRIGVLDEALQGAGDEAKVALEAERSRVAGELAALRAQIAAHDARYAALLTVPEAGPADAPRVLRPGDLFLSYTVQDGQVLAIALDAGGRLDARVVPIQGSLRDAIEGWRALLLTDPSAGPAPPVWIDGERVALGVVRPGPQARRASSADEVGEVLARWLLAPLGEALARAERLVIAPDPALALVPFDALPWNRRPLVASVEIAHVQSFGVLALLRAGASGASGASGPSKESSAASPLRPRRVLVVADPAFGGAGRGGSARRASDLEAELRFSRGDGVAWTPLPGTRREAQAVAQVFPQRQVLLGGAASESELARLAATGSLQRVDVMHFATHGLISARRPWSSALVLAAPPPGAPEDGYLTALEMSRLGIASRLVVLSACDTATGNALEGEGVLGFPYVLLASGAASTMLTLWPIDDAATARLMPEVLAGVRAGLAPSQALARAKRRWIAREGAGRARDWAGVLVYGL